MSGRTDIIGKIDPKVEDSILSFLELGKQIHKEYSDQWSICEIISNAFRTLLSEPYLPENPFLDLCKSIRLTQIKNSLWTETPEGRDEEILVRLKQKTQSLMENKVIFAPANSTDAGPFGLEKIIKFINPTALLDIWKAITIGPSSLFKLLHGKSKKPSLEAYDVKVHTALVGESILYQSLKSDICHLGLHHEYLITSKSGSGSFETVVKSFAQHILVLLRTCINKGEGVIEGVYLATASRRRGEEGVPKIWNSKELQQKQKNSRFINDIKATIIGKRRIFCDIFYKLKINGSTNSRKSSEEKYFKIRRHFTLHYKESTTSPIRRFSFYPLECLGFGVFFDAPTAMSYYEIYSDLLTTPASLSSKPNENNNNSKTIQGNGVSDDDIDRKITMVLKNRLFKYKSDCIKACNNDMELENCYSKLALLMIHYQNESFIADLYRALKKSYAAKNICTLIDNNNMIINILEQIIVISRDSKSTIYHGEASSNNNNNNNASFHTRRNNSILSVNHIHVEDTEFLRHLKQDVIDMLKQFIDDCHENLTDITISGVKHIYNGIIKLWMELDKSLNSSIYHTIDVEKYLMSPILLIQLKKIQYWLKALELSLWREFNTVIYTQHINDSKENRDAIEQLAAATSPKKKKKKSKNPEKRKIPRIQDPKSIPSALEMILQDILIKNNAYLKAKDTVSPKDKKKRKKVKLADLDHEFEVFEMPLLRFHVQQLKDQANNIQLVDIRQSIKLAISSNIYPSYIAKEAVILSYVVDKYLDESIETFHYELLTGHLVNNPLPRLIDHLHKYSLKITQNNKALMEDFQKYKCSLVPGSTHAYQTSYRYREKEYKSYGSLCAVQLADPVVVDAIFTAFPCVANQTSLSNITPFNEVLSTSIEAESTWGNKLLHYYDNNNNNNNSNATTTGDTRERYADPLYLPAKICASEIYLFEGPDIRRAGKYFAEHITKHVIDLHSNGSGCSRSDISRTSIQLALGSFNVLTNRVSSIEGGSTSTYHKNSTSFDNNNNDNNNDNNNTSIHRESIYTVSSIKRDQAGVEKEIRKYLLSRQSIVLKCTFIDNDTGRFIPFEKHLCFMFKDSRSQAVTNYIPLNNYLIYTGVFRDVASISTLINMISSSNSEYNSIRDPMEYDSYQYFANQLKVQIKLDVEDGNILSAYRHHAFLLSVRCEIALLPDVLRVFKSDIYYIHRLNHACILYCYEFIQTSKKDDLHVLDNKDIKSHILLFIERIKLSKIALISLSSNGIWDFVTRSCDEIVTHLTDEDSGVSGIVLTHMVQIFEYLSVVIAGEIDKIHMNAPQTSKAFNMIKNTM